MNRRILSLSILVAFSLPASGWASPEESVLSQSPWEHQFLFSRIAQEGGYLSDEVAFTAAFNLNDQGHALLGGLTAGRRRLESDPVFFGAILVGGRLGFGDFSPSLRLTGGVGGDDYRTLDITLDGELRVSDPLSLNLSLFSQYQEHTSETDPLGIFPVSGTAYPVSNTVQGFTLGALIHPAGWVSVPLSTGYWTSGTGEIAGTSPDHRSNRDSGSIEGGRISTVAWTIGLTLRPQDNWVFGVIYQRGQDRLPNEPYYSTRTGSSPASSGGTTDWDGYSIWAGYSF